MKSNYDINSLIYSFYNSFTLLFAELEGRYYGGGVLELTPKEFKKLPVPMTVIDSKAFEIYVKAFEKKSAISEILLINDSKILKETMNLTDEEIKRIQCIYQKLVSKRLRK
jgi:adenine-specific DNA-methyltransferase